MENNGYVIWSDYDIDIDDWREVLEEDYPDSTDDELYQIVCERNIEDLHDERANLNIQLSRPIIVIADLGLWNGRFSGYKEIESGNIKDCLYSDAEYNTWYLDKYGDLRCDAVHHDGTNHYLYRTYKSGVSEDQIERFKEKIYNGKATRADITRITQRLGDDIAKVYGWKIPRERSRGEAR